MRKANEGESRDSNYAIREATVVRCTKLNIRKEPDLKSKILGVVREGDQIRINTDFNHPTFARVITPSGIKGYAVKIYLEETD